MRDGMSGLLDIVENCLIHIRVLKQSGELVVRLKSRQLTNEADSFLKALIPPRGSWERSYILLSASPRVS